MKTAFVFLAGILCASAPALAQKPATRPPAERQAAAPGVREDRSQEHQRKMQDVARLLNLTPEQRTKARQSFDRAWNESEQVRAEMQQDREQIKSLFTNANSARFNTEVDRLASRQGQLYARMIEIHTKAMKDFYSMLTPEQQKKADDLYDLLTAQAPLRYRMGPGAGMRNPPTE